MTWIHDLVTAVTFAIVFQLGRYFGHRDLKKGGYTFQCLHEHCDFTAKSDNFDIIDTVADIHEKQHEKRS